jgi:hypothetical protein
MWPIVFNAPALEAACKETHQRPPPWFEIVPLAECYDLLLALSRKLHIPATTNIRLVLDAARAAAPSKPSERHAFPGRTEPPSSFIARHGLATDGSALVLRDLKQSAVRLRTRDLIEFEQYFFADDTWAIDEHIRWIAFGPHDGTAQVIKFT